MKLVMKQVMGTSKKAGRLQQTINSITDTSYNWDSLETRALFYKEKIKKYRQSLNQLSIMGDAKTIISLCGKIKAMQQKLRLRK
jgi:hypothetical protein